MFAIPGSIHSPMSKGCHQLIKQGAKLVDCLQDIVEDLNLNLNLNLNLGLNLGLSSRALENSALTKRPADTTTVVVNPLLELMGYEAISLESLVHLSHLTVSEVSSMLMLLELDGSIASLAGGQYQKIV